MHRAPLHFVLSPRILRTFTPPILFERVFFHDSSPPTTSLTRMSLLLWQISPADVSSHDFFPPMVCLLPLTCSTHDVSSHDNFSKGVTTNKNISSSKNVSSQASRGTSNKAPPTSHPMQCLHQSSSLKLTSNDNSNKVSSSNLPPMMPSMTPPTLPPKHLQ